MNEKKLKARDFITIGIFTAILWVVQMVIMLELSIFVQSLNPQNYAASVNGCSKRLL